jgi:molybdopterin molybdotransferase
MAAARAPVPDPECFAGLPNVPAHQLRLHGRLLCNDHHHSDDDDRDEDEPCGTGAEAAAKHAAGHAQDDTGPRNDDGASDHVGRDDNACAAPAAGDDGDRADDDDDRSAPADHDDRHAHAIAVADDLLTIDEALALVLQNVAMLDAEDVPLADAAGRVLAEPARSAVDLPPFPSSAMDGFALRAADAPGTLPVVAHVAAGKPAPRPLEAGEAMAISTGGVVPDGADSVVPIELVEERDEGTTVVISGNVALSDNVRHRGGDLREGDLVVDAGVRLGPAHVGALAASGVTSVRCTRVPRVAIIVTGSELRAPGERLEPGQIYDANGFILAAQLRSTGAEVERLPPVADDEAATHAAIEHGLAADMLVTTGGVSVGVHDLVRATEAKLGVEEIFWRVAMQPGKPVAFGVRGRTLVFGLPGNPVSSLVGFELFVRPALLALQGLADPRPSFRPGRLGGPAKRLAARDALLRARTRVEGDAVLLDPLTGQQSHMIAQAAAADALVLVPQGEGELAAGSPVSYLEL